MGFFFFKKNREGGNINSITEPIRREVKNISLPPAFLVHTKVHEDSHAYILPMDREFFIGSNKKNDLCLEREDIPDIYAKIRPERDGYIFYNLSPKSEIYINLEKILKHRLEHKDRIKIGSHILMFEFIKEEETFWDGIDTRKTNRIRPIMALKFLINSGKKLEEYSSVVKDISLDGVRIETERELQKGSIIEAGIFSSEFPLIEVIAEVIWRRVKDKDDKILYDVGLQFLEMDEKSKKRLKDYLSK